MSLLSCIRPTTLSVALACAAGSGAAPAGAEEDFVPDPDRVLQAVRSGYIAQNLDVEGRLRSGFTSKPFKMSVQNGAVRFEFTKTGDVLELEMTPDRMSVRERVGGNMVEVDPSRYRDKVQGMELTYEDLAMRFLYWPNAQYLGEDKVSGLKCFKVAVSNPGEGGPYDRVTLWVGATTGAVMRMSGADTAGRELRRFLASSVHKIDDAWIFKSVRVESMDPEKGKVRNRLYLETQNPKKRGSPLKRR